MTYGVKDGGERETYASGMVREPAEGKLLFTLIPTFFLKRFAAHMTKGAQKYPRDNWKKANSPDELERARDSAFRHFVQWLDGEDDEDHAMAIVFNVMEAEWVQIMMRGQVVAGADGRRTERVGRDDPARAAEEAAGQRLPRNRPAACQGGAQA